jgi:hypothetical protein
LKFKRNYIYEVVKRKAIRIERLPAPIPEKQKDDENHAQKDLDIR